MKSTTKFVKPNSPGSPGDLLERKMDDDREKKDLLKMVALLMIRQGLTAINFTSQDLDNLQAERPDLAIVITGGGDNVSVSLEDRPRTYATSLEFH